MGKYTKQSYQQLAEQIISTGKFTPEEFGLTYRKGKVMKDVLEARRKAVEKKEKDDREPKVILAAYLQDVLKRKS